MGVFALSKKLKTENSIPKEKISLDCLIVCLYLISLPLTVVSTPFGSVLRLVTFPVVGLLSARLLMGKSDLSLNYIHFFYMVYIAYTVIGLIFLHDEMAVTVTRDMILIALTIMLITMRIYNNREKELMETIWFIVGLFCIYLSLTSTEYLSEYESRVVIKVFGFSEDQNQFCAYLIMPVLVCLKRFIEKYRFYPVYLVVIVLAMYAVLRTGSRGGLIGIIAGMMVYILFGIKSMKTKVLIIIAALFTAFIVVTVVFPMLPEDVQNRYNMETIIADRGTGRLDVWAYLLNYVAEDPMRIIHGTGMFSTYGILENSTLGFSVGVAHNTFIQILVDQGLIGLVLFTFVIGACFIRNFKRQPLYMCAFLSVMVFSLSLTFYVFKPYINIMIMCAMTFRDQLPENMIKNSIEEEGKE